MGEISVGTRNAIFLVVLSMIGLVMPVFVEAHRGWGPGTDHLVIWAAAQGERPYDGLFPYPPIMLPFLWPLRFMTLQASYMIFNFVGACLFAWAARPLWWAVFLPGAVMCLSYGQTGLIIGAFWLLAFRGSGVGVAFLAMKPQLGFLGIMNLRKRRAWLTALLALLALCLLPTVTYGAHIWIEWLVRGRKLSQLMSTWNGWSYISISMFNHWGVPPWLGGVAAASLLLLKTPNVYTCATAALIISPYDFIYDMPVASLGFAVYFLNDDRALAKIILGLLVASPGLTMFGAAWIPLALLAGLCVQVTAKFSAPECLVLHGARPRNGYGSHLNST